QVVQVRGAGAPVAEDEQRRLDADRPDLVLVQPVLDAAPERVAQAAQGDHGGARGVAQVHRAAIVAQQPQPVVPGDAAQAARNVLEEELNEALPPRRTHGGSPYQQRRAASSIASASLRVVSPRDSPRNMLASSSRRSASPRNWIVVVVRLPRRA